MQPGDRYQHKTEGLCIYLCTVMHTETREPLVVFEQHEENRALRAQPLESFVADAGYMQSGEVPAPAGDTDIYQHYKGGRYAFVGYAERVDREEALVIYHALGKPAPVYARPIAMFYDLVDADLGEGVVKAKRFALIVPDHRTPLLPPPTWPVTVEDRHDQGFFANPPAGAHPGYVNDWVQRRICGCGDQFTTIAERRDGVCETCKVLGNRTPRP